MDRSEVAAVLCEAPGVEPAEGDGGRENESIRVRGANLVSVPLAEVS